MVVAFRKLEPLCRGLRIVDQTSGAPSATVVHRILHRLPECCGQPTPTAPHSATNGEPPARGDAPTTASPASGHSRTRTLATVTAADLFEHAKRLDGTLGSIEKVLDLDSMRAEIAELGEQVAAPDLW